MLLVSAPMLFCVWFVHMAFYGIEGWCFWFELVGISFCCNMLHVGTYMSIYNIYTPTYKSQHNEVEVSEAGVSFFKIICDCMFSTTLYIILSHDTVDTRCFSLYFLWYFFRDAEVL
jgi:hypothetical protein